MPLKRNVQVRNGHRTFVTKTIDVVQTFLADFDPSIVSNTEKLRVWKTTLNEKKAILNKLDSTISEEISPEKIEDEINEASEFLQEIDRITVKIDIALEKISNASNPATQVGTVNFPLSSENVHDNASLSNNGNIAPKVQAKLPKLTLPRYSGEPTKWQPFWDSFESAVHKNSTISNVDKFNYLKGLLDGPAASCIAGVALTDGNYNTALDLLKNRFANPQLLISSHMDALLKLQAPTSGDIRSVRRLYDTIESHIRSLQALGVESKSYGSLLLPVIMNKIPEEMRLIVSRKFDQSTWDVDGMLKSFKTELEARERCFHMQSSHKEKHDRSKFNTKQEHTTTSLLAQRVDQPAVTCSYCLGKHTAVRCNIVTNIDARKEILKKKGKCFNCLRAGHIVRVCPSQHNCLKCRQRHHTSLCKGKENPTNQNERKPPPANEEPNNDQVSGRNTSTSLFVNSHTPVLLQTAKAYVYRPDNETKASNVRVIFDSCSQRSYVSQRLAKQLCLPVIGHDNLLIKTFGEESSRLRSCELVQVAVKGLDGLSLFVNAYVVPVICTPPSNQYLQVAVEQYPYLADLELAESASNSQEEIDILIGADYYWAFMTGHTRRGETHGPVAIHTRLGWVLSGPVNNSTEIARQESSVNFSATHVLKIEADIYRESEAEDIKSELSKFWDLETIGISNNELSVYDKFKSEVKQRDGRYEVSLPFKEEHPPLSDNYESSKRRLTALVHRLQQKPDVLKSYDDVIRDQLKNGVIEKVSKEEFPAPGKVHYLPHREVIRLDKETTKLRVVFDASAKSNGTSLNDCLYVGPPMSPLLYNILLRFRVHETALTADIEKAFLNISIVPEHRDFLRFMWPADPTSQCSDIDCYRFTRVVFGVNSSPFILNATIRHHLDLYQKSDPEFVAEVLRSLYVDDYASGTSTPTAGFALANKIRACFRGGGFNMRKWVSNSQELTRMIDASREFTDEDARNRQVISNEKECPSSDKREKMKDCHKVLGMLWKNQSDTLAFEFSEIIAKAESERVLTKRVVLRTAASFYDLLGLIAPIIVVVKIMFQQLCKDRLQWDDELDQPFQHKWCNFISNLKQVQELSVDRCYAKEFDHQTVPSVELHGFGDASNEAYGACIYIRYESGSETHCQLVTSKTRVCPMKLQTIPRLELLACLITARLITQVYEALKCVLQIDNRYCWSDSSVALAWIRSTSKEYKPFVQNRVNEIRKLISPECWRYCPTSCNPADTASRGCKPTDLVNDVRWWKGPTFLSSDRIHWPKSPKPASIIPHDEVDKELRRTRNETIVQASVNVSCNEQIDGITKVINATEYSSFTKLIRVTAYVIRFLTNLKAKKSGNVAIVGELTRNELQNSETTWLKSIQAGMKVEEKFNQVKHSLNVVEDDHGILRCKGRLENAPIHSDSKCPILLPGDHHVTRLVIEQCHRTVMHNGLRETLTQLRTRFWISKGRQRVKKVIAKCNVCKKIEGKSYGVPLTPPLPPFRLSDEFAFTKIGLDYAGPLFVKDIYGKGGKMNKAYIALYTCASSRALHLDLVPELSSEAFLRSFKRFVGRRGIPTEVLSDNAKTFKSLEVQEYIRSIKTTWKFNVEGAPWWGGFFERLVKSVKRCLKKVIRNARLTYEELLTVLIEVEGVLNSRPLTYVYDDDLQPLTPSQLVIGRRLLTNPDNGTTSEQFHDRKAITKREKHLQRILNHFWNRWRREYVTELREHHRQKSTKGKTAEIGDVVSVYEDKIPRHLWKLGRVEKLFVGRDGEVRAAELTINDKAGKVTTMRRPIQKLFPLEVNDSENKDEFAITFVEHAKEENNLQ